MRKLTVSFFACSAVQARLEDRKIRLRKKLDQKKIQKNESSTNSALSKNFNVS
jgi:hypothetical protein